MCGCEREPNNIDGRMSKLLSTGQAAVILGVSGKTVREWVHGGSFRSNRIHKLNGQWFIQESEVLRVKTVRDKKKV